MPNTYRRRRRDSTVELRRVGGIMELSLPGTFVPWNFRSRERKFQELSLPGAKVLRSESSCYPSVSAMWPEFATNSRRLPTDSVDNLETDQTDSIAVWLREFWPILITFSTMTSLCRHLSLSSTRNGNLGRDYRRVRSHRRRDSTRQLSRVGVGGVYWAWGLQYRLAAARCRTHFVFSVGLETWQAANASLLLADACVRREKYKLLGLFRSIVGANEGFGVARVHKF